MEHFLFALFFRREVVFFFLAVFLREGAEERFLEADFLRLGVVFFTLLRLRAEGEDLRVVFFLRDVEEDFLLAAM